MKRIWKILLGVAAVVIALPLAVALFAIVSIAVFDRANGSIVSHDQTRTYLLHVPDSYDPSVPSPLVVSMHAGATWPAHQKNLTGWNRLADEHGFLVAYPAGNRQFVNVARVWYTFERGPGLERDVQFIAELIDKLESEFNIDPNRIYADGMSNGGGMAFAVACSLSNRIAAVGMVAPAQSLPPDWCRSTRPVPMMAFHGDADRLAPYEGGPLGDPFNPVKPVFPAIRDFVAEWAMRNQCSANGFETTVVPDATRLEYRECAEGAAVVLYTLLGGGHSWPGGKPPPKWWVGETNTTIDATHELWTFYSEHQLQQPTGDEAI
jgi:polyhydroxybutyrate depolymerase